MATMDSLASTLSHSKYIDVDELDTSYKMWEKMKVIHGVDKHVMIAKAKILRGNFNEIRMQKGEEIKEYGKKLKDIMLAIRA